MIEAITNSLELIIQATLFNLPILEAILAVFILTFILTKLLPGLLYLGIIPRHWIGLPGILFSPFIHAHFTHLFFNLIPLLIFSDFLLIQGLYFYLKISVMITLISGLLVWLFAKPGIHIGASGLITGYWGFLVASSYSNNSITNIILAIISLYYFGGIFLGIFPSSKRGISWEGHLFGLIAGISVTFFL